MGLFDFFRSRRERESALPPSASVEPPSASIDEQPVVGQQVGGLGGPGLDLGGGLDAIGGLQGLAGIVTAMQKAAADGTIQVVQKPQSIDMTDAGGLRDELIEIMRRHGIDPESGGTESIDASAVPQMQQEMLEALSRHGLDLGTGA